MIDMDNAQRAEVLVQALPYIQKYAGKIVVIKFGGSAMVSQNLCGAVMGDITLLTQVGVRVVLVHGGGPEINEMLGRVDKKSEFINGLRVTDAETMEIAQMVLCGKINKNLVAQFHLHGGRAVGLCGADGHMLEVVPKDPALGYVGEITKVNPEVILDALDAGYIPVISTIGCDAQGSTYNINADTAAAAIAAALGAESLIALTDIAGILRDKDDDSTLISRIYLDEAPSLVADGIISGGMIPKVECSCEAIRNGVRRVFIIDGRVKHSILIELLTDEGMGTMFRLR